MSHQTETRCFSLPSAAIALVVLQLSVIGRSAITIVIRNNFVFRVREYKRLWQGTLARGEKKFRIR